MLKFGSKMQCTHTFLFGLTVKVDIFQTLHIFLLFNHNQQTWPNAVSDLDILL